jgi:sulfonate transport system permease protein
MTATLEHRSAPRRTIEWTPGPAEVDPVRAHRRRRLLEVGLAVAVPVALLGLWQLASTFGWIDARMYPSPTTIASTGWQLVAQGELWGDALATLRRVTLGWLVGCAIGAALGITMGSIPLVRSALEPTLDALYVVPKLALLPILFNIFGLGEGSQVALVAITVFFFVWIATMAAVMGVAEGYREAGRIFGARRLRMLRNVLLPAALPQIIVGVRVAAGVAFLVIIAAEYLVGQDGLGYLIFNSRNLFINDEMFAGIVVVALFGVAFSELIRGIGRRLVPWAPEDRGARTR